MTRPARRGLSPVRRAGDGAAVKLVPRVREKRLMASYFSEAAATGWPSAGERLCARATSGGRGDSLLNLGGKNPLLRPIAPIDLYIPLGKVTCIKPGPPLAIPANGKRNMAVRLI